MKQRTRITALCMAALVGITGALVAAAPAHAADYLHRIISRDGWCLEVPNSSMQMNEQLRVSVCGPTAGSWNEKFWFSDASLPNTYFIRPGHNLWCTQPGANISGSTVVQWACNWSEYLQQWRVERPEDPGPIPVDAYGPFVLRNSNGYCLKPDGPDVGALVRVTVNCGQLFVRDSSFSFWRLPYA